jgi:hypothetical protein
MKSFIFKSVTLCLVFLLAPLFTNNIYAVISSCEEPYGCGSTRPRGGFAPPGGGRVVLSRTYLQQHPDLVRAAVRYANLGRRNENPGSKSASSVSITFDDFSTHFAAGQDREVQWRTIESGIPMDVGGEDVEDLFWIMPDLSMLGAVQQTTINAPAVASTPYLGDFPDDLPTHAFDINGLFEYYELIPETASDPGAVYYIGGADADNIFLGDFVHAPIPLALGLGVFGGEFDPVLCSTLEDGCETGNPDEHSYQVFQEFEEVGTGTLQTYDDGNTEAIKVRNTIRIVVVDVNDVLLDEYETDYLIWYSKDGHYLRGELADDAPWTGNTSFTNIEYHKIATGALPVAWQEVSAEVKKDREVEIRWATASETDNERFIVERSTDGTNFLPIGSQPAVGNNTGTENYLFLDEAAQEGFNYYRIKQVDFTGGSSYSTVVSALVTVSGEEALHILYPNPGRDEVYFSRPASYELFTAQGQRLANGQAEGSLDVTDLPAGPYLVRLDGGKLYRWVKQ